MLEFMLYKVYVSSNCVHFASKHLEAVKCFSCLVECKSDNIVEN